MQNAKFHQPSRLPNPWGMVLLGAIFYAFQFIVRVSPAIMAEELLAELNIDATFLGAFTSCYYISYSLALIPLGLLLDRVGPHRLFPLCSAILTAGVLLFASTKNVYLACLARLLVGAGGACGFLGTLKLGTLWIPARSFGQVIALTTIFGTIGAILGATPLRHLFSLFGWRVGMWGLGAAGILLTVLLFVFVAEYKDQVDDEKPSDTGFKSIVNDMRMVLTSSQVWLIGVYSMLMYMPITIIGDLWGVPFISRAYHTHEEAAAAVVSAMFVGVFLGSPGFIYMSNRLESRRIPLILGAILCCVSNALALYGTSQPIWVMYSLFFSVGLFFGSKSVGFAVAVENLPKRVSGLTIGFVNTLIMTNGIFSLPLVGWLLDFGKDNYFPPTEEFIYTLGNFRFALSVIPIAILLSAVLVAFTRESFPKQQS